MFKKSKDKLYRIIEENPSYVLILIIILVGVILADGNLVAKGKSKLKEII